MGLWWRRPKTEERNSLLLILEAWLTVVKASQSVYLPKNCAQLLPNKYKFRGIQVLGSCNRLTTYGLVEFHKTNFNFLPIIDCQDKLLTNQESSWDARSYGKLVSCTKEFNYFKPQVQQIRCYYNSSLKTCGTLHQHMCLCNQLPTTRSSRKLKVYALVIVCQITAATNIELMSSYDTSSKIEALTNHCSLFKTPSIITMDAGSQFVKFAG